MQRPGPKVRGAVVLPPDGGSVFVTLRFFDPAEIAAALAGGDLAVCDRALLGLRLGGSNRPAGARRSLFRVERHCIAFAAEGADRAALRGGLWRRLVVAAASQRGLLGLRGGLVVDRGSDRDAVLGDVRGRADRERAIGARRRTCHRRQRNYRNDATEFDHLAPPCVMVSEE